MYNIIQPIDPEKAKDMSADEIVQLLASKGIHKKTKLKFPMKSQSDSEFSQDGDQNDQASIIIHEDGARY